MINRPRVFPFERRLFWWLRERDSRRTESRNARERAWRGVEELFTNSKIDDTTRAELIRALKDGKTWR